MSKIKDVVLSRLFLLTIVLVTLIFTVLGIFFNMSYQTYTFINESVCYYNDVLNVVPKGTRAINDNGKITLKNGDIELFVANTAPVYSLDEYKLTVMDDVGYYCLEDGSFTNYKLSFFTEVYLDSDNNVYASKNSDIEKMESGFIYDGNNDFIFLEDIKLSLGSSTINVNALSYVKYDDNKVYVYSFTGGKLDTYNVTGEVIANCNDYTLSLSDSECKIGSEVFILDNYFGDLKNYLNK